MHPGDRGALPIFLTEVRRAPCLGAKHEGHQVQVRLREQQHLRPQELSEAQHRPALQKALGRGHHALRKSYDKGINGRDHPRNAQQNSSGMFLKITFDQRAHL